MDEQNEVNSILPLEDKKEEKKINKKKIIYTAILCVSCLLNIYLVNVVVHSVSFSGGGFTQIQKLRLFKEIMSDYYYKEIKQSDLIEGCIKGMVQVADDKYTVYYSKDEMESFLETTNGRYTGVGISITLNENGRVGITDVYEGSSAKKAGIKAGDEILKVDGKDVTALENIDDISNLLKKEMGEEIILEVLRPETNSNIEFKLTVGDVKLECVESEVLEEDIGYIKLKMFDEDVSTEFKERLEKLKEQNVKALLLDLRDNPGGDYNEVITIADSLLPKDKLIVYTEDRDEYQEKEYSKEDGIDLPIIVLVNGNSASASEVLSGALKDNNRAWLLGTKTFGKGLVQSIVQFKDGSGLKVTTARYFTPSGECIQGKGIQPDYEVNLPKDYENYLTSQLPREYDTQLIEALKLIRTKI